MTAPTITVAEMAGKDIPQFLRQNEGLLREMQLPTFFASPEWFEAFLDCERDTPCFALVVKRAGLPIAMLPLQPERNWCGGLDLRYLGYTYYPDPLALVCAREDRTQAMEAIKLHLAGRRRWDRLVLDFMTDEEGSMWNGAVSAQGVAPYLELPDSFDALLKSFNGKKRYKLRNKIKVAEEAGLEFSVATTGAGKSECIRELFRLHEERSKRIGRKSSLRDQSVSTLHSALTASSPAAVLCALRKNGRVIAVTYGFLHRRQFFFFQITHDPEFDDLRPGTVIVAKTIAAVIEQGAREFNFLQGDEAYKFEWTQTVRRLVSVRLVAPRGRPRFMEWAERNLKRLREAVRRRRKGTDAQPTQTAEDGG